MADEIAQWVVELLTICPNCRSELDLLEIDDFLFMGHEKIEIAEQDTPRTKDVGVICEKCDHEFTVDFEY